jgi:hypothetical protein
MNQNNPQMQNDAAAAYIIGACPTVIQKIASITQSQFPYTAGQAQVINVPITNVGLIKRFWLRIQANVQQGAAETQTLQPLGPSNFLSQIILSDLSNLIRINTTGWHLSMINSARRQFPIGAAITSDTPLGFGANYNLVKAPSSVTAAANMYMVYEVPCTYSETDLRGGIFANVVNATMNLQLTLNANMFVASGADGVQAVYKSSTAQLGKVNSYTIDVYQEYYDQLPRNQDGSYALPLISLATQYNLLNTSQTGLAVGADQSLPYANFRSYMSTIVGFDNGGTLNAGSDINYFTLQTANAMQLFKLDPFMVQMLNGRNKINDDWPSGFYYFDHRMRPISTLAYGNIQLNVNPSTVNANALLLVGYEYFSLQNQLANAGSMSST